MSVQRRHQNRNASSYAEDASKLIRENMKCPVCLEVLLPPIYQCETGHNICHLCVDEVTECPLCKSDYGDTRNYFAEELVNSMSFPCKYEEYGCHKTFLGRELKDHQAICECQPYRCPELACQELVGIHQIAKHLDKHGFKVMKGDVHQASLEILDDHFERKTEYNPWRIAAFNTEFYTVSTRNREGIWHFWAYGLGLQKELRKFSYEIVLYSDEKQIMYRGVIQSLRNNPEDIIKNGNCLISNDQMIKSLRKGGRINCQVYFIQGKNWDAARGARSVDAKRNTKNSKNNNNNNNNNNSNDTKKKSCPLPKGKQQAKKCNKMNNNTPNNAAFTCPINLNGSSQKSIWGNSRSRGSSSVKDCRKSSSSNDVTKKEWTLNGISLRNKNRFITAAAKILANKSGKTSNGSPRPSSVPDDENSFVQRVRDTLRCPSCNEVITPPVFQCVIGHNVCHKCKMTRQDCSLCLSPLTECRNFFAEELLYKTYQRCLYSKYGCKVCLPSAQMKSHEAVCDYAPFECPFNVCRTLLRADDLLDHMKTHQLSVVDQELKHSEVFVPRNPPGAHVCIIPNILTVDTVAFYPIIVRESDGSWLFYVITHQYPKYRFELHVKKQAKALAFQGPVVSLRSNLTQVKLKGSGLLLTERAVKSFKTHEKLSYQIKISKIEMGPDGAQTKESTLNLPTSWVLTPRSGEIVSKTELFANKKTSVSPNEDSDDDGNDDDNDTLSSVNRADSSDTNDDESDMDEILSEDCTASRSISIATINQGDSEFESNSIRTQDSRESVRRTCAKPVGSGIEVCRKFSEHLKNPQQSATVLSSSLTTLSSPKNKNKKVSLHEEEVQPAQAQVQQQTSSLPEEKSVEVEEKATSAVPKEDAAVCTSSTAITTDCKNANGECQTTISPMVSNSNLEIKSKESKNSLSSESVTENFAGESPPGSPSTTTQATGLVSILKPGVDSLILLKDENSSSIQDLLKVAPKDTFGVSAQSSSLISDPLVRVPMKILKKGKRSNSASKHRVRLSDQVLCREVSDLPDEDFNGNSHAACRSQMNLRLMTSRTSIRTIPSQHVMAVEYQPDNRVSRNEEPESGKNEFQQLKQALSTHDANNGVFMEEVDLLTAKSLGEIKDAVISGSFDVVKSVMGLFSSQEPSETSEKPKENGEHPSTINKLNK